MSHEEHTGATKCSPFSKLEVDRAMRLEEAMPRACSCANSRCLVFAPTYRRVENRAVIVASVLLGRAVNAGTDI